jgi:predicted TPR repeat methyltransferase
MSSAERGDHLGSAYSAKRPEDIAKVYDNWAQTYDEDMSTAGYRHPAICVALLTRNLKRGATPILDAGAGTGLIGEWLDILEYPHVEGLDISEGMLAVAEKKDVYKALHNQALGGNLPFSDDHFAGIVSAGVFTTGHVGIEGLDELIRICKPEGVIVLTIKNSLWEAEFADHIAQLEQQKTIAVTDQSQSYVSMPGEVTTKPSQGIVLKVL